MRRKRLPRPTALGWRLGLGAAAVAAALGVAALARAEEEDVPRYQPATRGPRASYGTAAVERWREMVSAYDWDPDLALLVIACESQGDPDARNPWSGAAGLMQLYRWEWKARELFGPAASVLDPVVNIGTAYWIWRADGGRFGGPAGWRASMGCWS